jgi:hypothetical protein
LDWQHGLPQVATKPNSRKVLEITTAEQVQYGKIVKRAISNECEWFLVALRLQLRKIYAVARI